MMKKLPELLCPAGSPEAFDAAIEGGADAIYLGGAAFNARMHAKNFGGDDLRSAVLRAHAFGVKVYLTLNTLITERELPAYLDAAGEAAHAGVDALIVADLGGASAIRRVYPKLELHASTQMSGHNASMGRELQRLGFSRMVVARETSSEDLRRIVSESPIEVEAFVHGALCVSHSGQCLFSSIVGGRSGNRGECAQPCRLPFSCAECAKARGGDTYPLSLKDLSLAMHLPELIDMGVASLKIEGRMKAPEYVRDTARVWRRLLDECRGASLAEMRELADVFSRGGFTDGYYTKKIDRSMLGVRSEGDKSRTRAIEPFAGITRRVPIDVSATVKADRPIEMTVQSGERRATVSGDVPSPAQTAPLTHETVQRNLSKFGATCYTVGSFALELDEGLMLPISRLNDLRRRAISALEASAEASETVQQNEYLPNRPTEKRDPIKTARFYSAEQITKAAKGYFDRIYLPLDRFSDAANGVVMPSVIFDGDVQEVREMLLSAKARGAKYALVGNLGHLSLVLEAGLEAVGDYRLNLTNPESVAQMEALGVKSSILSPELTLPQIRDVGGNTAVIVYGRLPLMTLEKCIIREIADCRACSLGNVKLRDRRGVEFPVLREWEHRNVIYNSIPTCMSDREDALTRANVTAKHFLFSTETPREVDAVIEAHEMRTALKGNVRRI